MQRDNLLLPIILVACFVGCAVGVALLWLAGREITATMMSLAKEQADR